MPTKVNEKETPNSVVDMAAKFTEDAQIILAANQEAMEKNFATWQQYNQAYNKFFLEATQQVLSESLAFRQSLDKVSVDSFKKAQVLSLEERQLGLDAAELFQLQTQATVEYFARMFTTTSKMLTTTVLFSDWATERAAKLFTTVPTH